MSSGLHQTRQGYAVQSSCNIPASKMICSVGVLHASLTEVSGWEFAVRLQA